MNAPCWVWVLFGVTCWVLIAIATAPLIGWWLRRSRERAEGKCR